MTESDGRKMHCACSSQQRLFQGREDLPRVQTRCRSARRPTDPTSDVFEDLLIELDELIDGRPANGEQEI